MRMQRRIFFCILIFLSVVKNVSAQEYEGCAGNGPIYSRFIPQQGNVFTNHSQLLGWAASGSFGLWGTPLVPGTAYAGIFLPQHFDYDNNSSLKMNGYLLHAPLAGVRMFDHKNWLDLVGEFGLTAGRWKMTGENSKSTNPFWCPTIALQPRVMVGPILLSCRLEYDYDISRSPWKLKSGDAHLQALHQTGFYPSVMVGIDW